MRIHWSVATAALAAAVIHLPLLEAQQSTAVEIGVRVRVTTDAAHSTPSGTVVGLTRDSLVIAPPNAEFTMGFRRADITRLEISVGRRRNTLKGMWTGALVGAGAGVAVGYLSGDDDCGGRLCMFGAAEENAGLLGIALGAVGMVIGGIVGVNTTSDRWVTASQSWAVTPVVDARGRVGLAFSY